MYGPEIIEDLVREIRDEVTRASAHRVHRSVGERLRALRDLTGR